MKKINLLIVIFLLSIATSFAITGSDEASIVTVSLVNQDPDPALSGDVVELRIGLENRGGEALENLIVELLPEYPFVELIGEDIVQQVGTLGAYQYDDDIKIVKFKVRVDRDATEASYELKIKYFEEGSTTSVQKSVFVDVKSRENAEVIYIDQVELLPGQITPLKFTINNVGSAPLRDLTFNWDNEDDLILPVGSDNTKYIRYIEIGESEELTFDVIASGNAEPDLYKLDLTLSYDDPATSVTKEINTQAGIYVGGQTDFDVAYSGISSGEASFSIANIGSVSASAVTVRVPDQRGWRVTGSNAVIIGNLNEGDYTIASFSVQPVSGMVAADEADSPERTQDRDSSTFDFRNRSTDDDSTLELEIVYTDSRGNRNAITKEVEVDSSAFSGGLAVAGRTSDAGMNKPSSASQTSNQLVWIGTVVVFVIIGIFVYRRYYHPKKTKSYASDPSFKRLMQPKKKE